MGCCESSPTRCYHPQTYEQHSQRPKGAIIYADNSFGNLSESGLESGLGKEFNKLRKIKPAKIGLLNEASQRPSLFHTGLQNMNPNNAKGHSQGNAKEKWQAYDINNECNTPCNSPNTDKLEEFNTHA